MAADALAVVRDRAPPVIVWSMGRCGSHVLAALFGADAILHAVCLDNGYTAPSVGTYRYDPTKPPDGVGSVREEWARKIREGSGVEIAVPVRNPVHRAVSAWRYFHGGRGSIGEYGHSQADRWWVDQLERWGGPHSVEIVRMEDVAPVPRPTGEVDFPEPLVRFFRDRGPRGCRTARTFYTEREIEEALGAYRHRT